MNNVFRALTFTLLTGGLSVLSASTICPVTPTTTSDCDYLITISGSGAASVTNVAGSTAFNSAVAFSDGTSDPGGDASLVGVIDNDPLALTGLTLTGSGANAGIFDFSFNGICVYTSAPYCGTAQTGYEGPTSTFGNLQSTILFETTEGTVTFNPPVAPGTSTYFSIEDAAADINANGGLQVSNVTFAGTAAPEPASLSLSALALGTALLIGRKLRRSA